MLVTKINIFLLPLFFISTLSSCEKPLAQEEPIAVLIEPVVKLEEVRNDIAVENKNLTSQPHKELGEIESLNKKTLDLSLENEALEKKIRALTQEFNELKQTILDKINKNNAQ